MLRFATLGIAALTLAGCSTQNPQPVPSSHSTSIVESEEVDNAAYDVEPNEWLRACQNYKFDGTEPFELAYQSVVEDVCGRVDISKWVGEYETAPNVSIADVERYMNAEKFHESYWLNYMNPDFPPKFRLIFSELDQTWWEEKQNQYILSPDLDWFTSKDEGGHCRVESDIFCPMFYEPKLTTTGIPTEFRIIGTELKWDDWRLLNSAHEAVHLYQDSHGMSHWADWYVEGQATFFELAMADLLFESGALRKEFIFNRPLREDAWLFNPKSPEDVVDYIEKCRTARSGECDSFKYGVGSMFHEKLVIDFGLEAYFGWQSDLIEQMPKGNPAQFNQEQMRDMIETFESVFDKAFGLPLATWESTVVAKYIYEYFAS